MSQTIEWLPEYETGNPEVDLEHKALCNLVNLIIIANQHSDRGRAVTDGIAALQRYVDTHFENEERLLSQLNSRHLDRQVAEHNALRDELRSLFQQPSQDALPTHQAIRELALWAKNRLLHHFVFYDSATFESAAFEQAAAEPTA